MSSSLAWHFAIPHRVQAHIYIINWPEQLRNNILWNYCKNFCGHNSKMYGKTVTPGQNHVPYNAYIYIYIMHILSHNHMRPYVTDPPTHQLVQGASLTTTGCTRLETPRQTRHGRRWCCKEHLSRNPWNRVSISRTYFHKQSSLMLLANEQMSIDFMQNRYVHQIPARLLATCSMSYSGRSDDYTSPRISEIKRIYHISNHIRNYCRWSARSLSGS